MYIRRYSFSRSLLLFFFHSFLPPFNLCSPRIANFSSPVALFHLLVSLSPSVIIIFPLLILLSIPQLIPSIKRREEREFFFILRSLNCTSYLFHAYQLTFNNPRTGKREARNISRLPLISPFFLFFFFRPTKKVGMKGEEWRRRKVRRSREFLRKDSVPKSEERMNCTEKRVKPVIKLKERIFFFFFPSQKPHFN